jgi:hypothetical protein
MQNWLASVVLIAWPLLAIYLFATQSLSRAILWTIMGAQMALPVGAIIKFEMIPQFDKFSIPNLCILLGCMIVARRPLQIVSRLGLTEMLIGALLVSPIITSQFNSDPVMVAGAVNPGATLYDALSAAESGFIFIIPFFIGRQFLRTAEHSREILYVLAMAGLIYSLPMLYEIRMSPVLQYQIYGFAATDFVMTARGGGYRPMVFMGHGLIASFFMMTTAVAATALWRARRQLFRLPPAGVTAYLSGVLVLCKSFGSLLYGMVLIPAVRWTGPRFQMRLAVILVSIALIYPALRSLGWFPTNTLVQMVQSVSDQRSLSLDFRFKNEDKLLERAFERPIFGWSRYGRNRVYSDSGIDESVTDGLWVITFGQYGLFGFLAQFGLLSIGVFRAASALRLAKSMTDAIFICAIALIVAVNIVELIPNSGLMPWTWLLSGALVGRSEALQAEAIQRRRLKKMAPNFASHGALPS